MVEPTSLQPLLIHAQEMAMQWLHVLGFHSRFVLLLLAIEVSFLDLVTCHLIVSLYLFFLQDLEFVQFHPTGIYGAGCLITEG